jgi:methyl coenzyme M reductase beta subunit
MTENELKKLAQMTAKEIVKLIEIKQLDEMFIDSLNDPYELLIAELARLMTLLASYEESEQYEKAAIIKNKIDKLQKQIEKL